jgi:uncharacterized protein YceH (UPF0502 family)
MLIELDENEARVLASLIEKEITTPEYYPLSLNALLNACRQKSNRDPVMNLEEQDVREALEKLRDKRLAGPASSAESRVTKYEHRIAEVFNFDRRETAIVCELLLRGPQTPGELRSHADRMHHFDDLGTVELTLSHLAERDPPLVTKLPRQPGTKESRYAQLLTGDAQAGAVNAEVPAGPQPADEDARVTELEQEVKRLRQEISEVHKQLMDFIRRFE